MTIAHGFSDERRAAAAALFKTRGIPNRRVEEWKYSDLKSVLGETSLREVLAQWVIRNLPKGVEIFDLSEGNPPDWVANNFGQTTANVMSAASLAFSGGGIAFRVPKATCITDPLIVDFSGSGHVRSLLVLEEGASLSLVETAQPAEFRNVGLEVILAEQAQLEHVRLSLASDAGVLVEEALLRLAAGARYNGHFAGFGSKLSRMELEIALEGKGAQAYLSGIAVLDSRRHNDVTTHLRHLVGDTHSDQLFKQVVSGHARAIYQGKVTVAKAANGSDSNQTAKALVLSDQAEADLKPELEILADDVKCSHGAAVGDLDADSLFYLRARGLPEIDARRLLMQAFLEDALARIMDADRRELVRTQMLAALGRLA